MQVARRWILIDTTHVFLKVSFFSSINLRSLFSVNLSIRIILILLFVIVLDNIQILTVT